MKEEELKKLISYTAIIAVLIWVAVILSLNIEFISFDSLQHFGTVISAIGMCQA
jgi:hypothetical protein